MKKCQHCNEEIQENMRFCPYCGTEQKKDYKSELNDAMSELFEEEQLEKTTKISVHSTQNADINRKNHLPVIEADDQKKDQVNKNLSKFLTGVIIVLIIALIGVVAIIGSNFFKNNRKPQNQQPPVVEKEEPKQPEVEQPKIDEPKENDNDPEDVDFKGTFSDGVNVSKVEVAKEEGKIKLMVTYSSPGAVEVCLLDASGNVQIGPFDLDKGTNFYLLLNDANQETYTIKIVDKTNSKESTLVITGQEIKEELN